MDIGEWRGRFTDGVERMSDEALAVAVMLARREANTSPMGVEWLAAVESELERRVGATSG